jgi:hypothetical protein
VACALCDRTLLERPQRARKATFWELQAAHFYEFSPCSDAEPILGGIVRVSVIVAPRGILLVVHMASDRHGNQNDGCTDDWRDNYQPLLFHVLPLVPANPHIGSILPSQRELRRVHRSKEASRLGFGVP